ncbi:MAG: histidinol-phosphate transaminase [Clostridia bacterium]|nr:histidinol-phosphate transaminase [Clostridia bacterium]
MNYLCDKARRLTPYTAGAQPVEAGWIKLNTNENPYPVSPKAAEALRNLPAERLRLYPDGTSGELRQAIAACLGVGAENVFCGNGSDEVLALAFQAFFGAKNKVVMPDISYGFYPVWSEMYDVNAEIAPVGPDFTINSSDYKGANGVVIANPNAPTGIALSLAEVEEIVRSNPAGVVVVDEAYIDFSGVKSAVSLIGKYDNLLVVRTFSKSYSLAGLRVGFAVGNRTLTECLERVKNAFNSYPLDLFAQTGAAAAMHDREYWEEGRCRVIATREKTRRRLLEAGWNVLPSHTNFLFLEAGNAKGFYEYLLNSKILVRYWDRPRIDRFVRVSIGTDDEMEAFIQCARRFWKEKPTKRQ